MGRRGRQARTPARPARIAAALLALGAVLAAARPAAAEVKRYALVFASNKGHADERDLRYAESDASRVRDTLAKRGGVPLNHIAFLAGAGADEVRNAAYDINIAIKNDVAATPGAEAVLFVYYSGHGDARALHLGASDLVTTELSKIIQGSAAKLKVLVLDACRSGTLTRVKGGRQVAPFQIEADERLRSEGFAIITSSAAGEDSQEHEDLRSSLFTHYFLSGLAGVADSNRDRKVTLGEAYAYAYEETLKKSAQTMVGFQHPTFDFVELRGRFDPVLADLRVLGDQAQIVFTSPGSYLVLAHDSVVLEANVREANQPVVVPADRYTVLMTGRTSMYTTDVALHGGETRALGPESMRAVSAAQVARKGATARTLAQGPSVAGLLQGPIRQGFGPMLGAQLGYAFELPRFSLMPRLGIQGGSSHDLGADVLSNRLREISVELTALHVFDVGPLSVAPLVSAGLGLFQQTVVEPDSELQTNPVTALFAVGLVASYPLGAGFSVDAGAELMHILGKVQDEAQAPVSWRLSQVRGLLTYRATLGLGYRF